MSKWQPIDTAPAGDAVLIRDAYSWTLGRLIAREVQTLQFGWPLVKYETKWGWVYACSRVQPVDFVPTEWCRVEHGTLVAEHREIIFTCLKCEANYNVEDETDECPVCSWRRVSSHNRREAE